MNIAVRARTELTAGNLGTQLSKLEEEGLVEIEKRIIAKKMRTTAVLTEKGRQAMREFTFSITDILAPWKELENG